MTLVRSMKKDPMSIATVLTAIKHQVHLPTCSSLRAVQPQFATAPKQQNLSLTMVPVAHFKIRLNSRTALFQIPKAVEDLCYVYERYIPQLLKSYKMETRDNVFGNANLLFVVSPYKAQRSK